MAEKQVYSNSGYFDTNPYTQVTVGTPYLHFEWEIVKKDIIGNKHEIHWKVTGKGLNDYMYCYLHKLSIRIDSELVLENNDINMAVYNETLVAEGSKEIVHNADGSRWFEAEIKAGFYNIGVENVSGTGNWNLEKIERYAVVNINVKNKDINTISISWDSDVDTDSRQYKINNDGWKDTKSTNTSTEGYFTIKELTADTIYLIKIRAKRADNQLWTESNEISIKTDDFGKFVNIIDKSDFAESIDITKKNESNIENTLEIYVNEKLITTRNNIEDTYILIFEQYELDKLYKEYGNDNELTVTYKLITLCNNIKYEDIITNKIKLTGNVKVTNIVKDGIIKRAKIYIKKDGIIKRGILFMKNDGTIKKCM